MRIAIIIQLLLVTCFQLTAQSEGIIEYRMDQKLEINVDNEAMGGIDISGMLPSERTTYEQLIFNEVAHIFKASENKPVEENEDILIESEGFQIEIVQSDIDEQTYIDRTSKKLTELRAFMDAPFIIEKDLPKFDWKITTEKVQYLDQLCMKATTTNDDGEEVIAWFAPSIPISIGPDIYQGLPGAILMLSIDGERLQYKALSITSQNVENLDKPKDGKKVTEEEFDTIVEKRMEEMMSGRGETFIIRG